MDRKYIIIPVLACLTATANAQMDNVVEVENDFRPTVQDATKINTLPEIEQTPLTHYNVDYTTNSFPTTNYAFQPIWAAHNDRLLKPEPKGFVALGYGMDANVLGRMAYEFDLAAADKLAFDFSSQGYKSNIDLVTNNDETWASRMFTNRLKANYCHWLDETSNFYINAGYGADVFNYQPAVAAPLVTDKQHNDLIDLGIGITPYNFGNFGLGANAELHTFKQKYATTFNEGNSELLLEASITPEYHAADNLAFDVDLAVEYANYSMDVLPGAQKAVEGYTSFDATPHIYWSNDFMDIKAGVYVNNELDIAPDVDVVLHLSPQVDAYLQAHGGEISNSFRHFSTMSPYWTLNDTELDMENQFDQLRGRGGVRIRPARFLALDLSAGYDISKNRAEVADFLAGNAASGLIYSPIVFADGKHFYANANIKLNYRNRITADLNTRYNQWDSDYELAGTNTDPLWRPEFEADWKVAVYPIEKLQIGADLLFESFQQDDSRYKRVNTINLGATVSYTLPCRLTVFAKGDNLLNRQNDQYIMYRSQGINFLAGAAFTF